MRAVIQRATSGEVRVDGEVVGFEMRTRIPYYRGIVFGVQERMGERVFPPMTIESLDVYRVLELCEGRRFDELVDYLGDGLDALAAAGADFAALSANTPHIVLGRLQERSPLPLVSIVEAARADREHADAAARRRVRIAAEERRARPSEALKVHLMTDAVARF